MPLSASLILFLCIYKLLTPKDAGKRKERPEEDLALLDQVAEANTAAGQEYLEYLVLHRKSSVSVFRIIYVLGE